MIAKIVVIIIAILAIPLLVAGYGRYAWYTDQQRWAAAREAAEVRYWDMIELNCEFGELTDFAKCSEAIGLRAARHELPM
jgi:hypothetical protein